MREIVLALALVWPLASTAQSDIGWRAWEHGLHRACPNRHADWIADGSYTELIDAFARTLAARTRAQVAKTANSQRLCAKEQIGFSCEMATALNAYRRLGLMDRFVKFNCRTVKCEERSICSRFPDS